MKYKHQIHQVAENTESKCMLMADGGCNLMANGTCSLSLYNQTLCYLSFHIASLHVIAMP